MSKPGVNNTPAKQDNVLKKEIKTPNTTPTNRNNQRPPGNQFQGNRNQTPQGNRNQTPQNQSGNRFQGNQNQGGNRNQGFQNQSGNRNQGFQNQGGNKNQGFQNQGGNKNQGFQNQGGNKNQGFQNQGGNKNQGQNLGNKNQQNTPQNKGNQNAGNRPSLGGQNAGNKQQGQGAQNKQQGQTQSPVKGQNNQNDQQEKKTPQTQGLGQNKSDDKDKTAVESSEKKFTGRCRLFVGNLTADITENDFRKLFEPYGEISEVYVNSSRGFGFIRLDYRHSAEAAKAALDGFQRKGRQLRVRFATHGAALKVKHLHPYVSNELLESSFQQFGDLERCVVIVDDRGKPTGEGIVEFERKPGANSALRRINEGVFLMGADPKPIAVEPLEQKDEEDGMPEKFLTKTDQYKKEREKEPRFALPNSFEHEFGQRWKKLEELEKKRIEQVKKDTEEARLKLEDEMQTALYDYQAEKIRQDLMRQQEELRRLEELRNQDRARRQQEMDMRESQEDRRRNDYYLSMQQQEIATRTNRGPIDGRGPVERGPMDARGPGPMEGPMRGRDEMMMAEGLGDRMPEGMRNRGLVQRMGDRMPERMPGDRMPGDRMPPDQRMGDRMPERMPDRMGDRMSDQRMGDRGMGPGGPGGPGQPGGFMWEEKQREAGMRGEGRGRDVRGPGPGAQNLQPPPVPPEVLERGGPVVAAAAAAAVAAAAQTLKTKLSSETNNPKPLMQSGPGGPGFGGQGPQGGPDGPGGENPNMEEDNRRTSVEADEEMDEGEVLCPDLGNVNIRQSVSHSSDAEQEMESSSTGDPHRSEEENGSDPFDVCDELSDKDNWNTSLHIDNVVPCTSDVDISPCAINAENGDDCGSLGSLDSRPSQSFSPSLIENSALDVDYRTNRTAPLRNSSRLSLSQSPRHSASRYSLSPRCKSEGTRSPPPFFPSNDDLVDQQKCLKAKSVDSFLTWSAAEGGKHGCLDISGGDVLISEDCQERLFSDSNGPGTTEHDCSENYIKGRKHSEAENEAYSTSGAVDTLKDNSDFIQPYQSSDKIDEVPSVSFNENNYHPSSPLKENYCCSSSVEDGYRSSCTAQSDELQQRRHSPSQQGKEVFSSESTPHTFEKPPTTLTAYNDLDYEGSCSDSNICDNSVKGGLSIHQHDSVCGDKSEEEKECVDMKPCYQSLENEDLESSYLGKEQLEEEQALPSFDVLSSYKQSSVEGEGSSTDLLEEVDDASRIMASSHIYQSYGEGIASPSSSSYLTAAVTSCLIGSPVIAQYNTSASDSTWMTEADTSYTQTSGVEAHSTDSNSKAGCDNFVGVESFTSTQNTVTEASMSVSDDQFCTSSSTAQSFPSNSTPSTNPQSLSFSSSTHPCHGASSNDSHEAALCTGDQTFKTTASRQSAPVPLRPTVRSVPYPTAYTGTAMVQGLHPASMLSSSTVHIAQHTGGATIMRHQSLSAGPAGGISAQATIMRQQATPGGLRTTALMQQRTLSNGAQTVVVQQRTMTTGLGAMSQQTVVQQRLGSHGASSTPSAHSSLNHGIAVKQAQQVAQQRVVRFAQPQVVGQPVLSAQTLQETPASSRLGQQRLHHAQLMGQPVVRAQVLRGAGSYVGHRLVRAAGGQSSLMQQLVRQRYLGGPVMPGRGLQMMAGRPVRVKLTYPREGMHLGSGV